MTGEEPNEVNSMDVKNMQNTEHYTWGDVCDGWRLLNRPDLSVIRERIPPGRGEVVHYHTRTRQLFYVLEGQLDIIAGETTARLTQGDSLEIPPMQHHQVRNASDSDVDFLVVSAPSTINDRTNVRQ
jgi:mannose-6-phosphate isomerase-like protein (cupin superfamily)